MNVQQYLMNLAKKTKEASRILQLVPEKVKNKVLIWMAESLKKNTKTLIRANKKDLTEAKKRNKSLAFQDRLMLNQRRIEQMSKSLKTVAALPDPVGKTMASTRRPNGLLIKKVRVPIGVIAIIYESRPNVTSDCIGLCLKSGNAVILRGGQQALHSNLAIFNVLREALKKHNLPEAAINLVRVTQREAVEVLLGLEQFIDLVIPHGG